MREEARGPIRVAIADDEALVRATLMRALSRQRDIEVVAVVTDAKELASLALDGGVDVVVTDRLMPGDVPEAIRAIRSRVAAPAVIVLSAFDDTPAECLDAGACTYLLKSASPTDILNAIRDEARWRSRLLCRGSVQ